MSECMRRLRQRKQQCNQKRNAAHAGGYRFGSSFSPGAGSELSE